MVQTCAEKKVKIFRETLKFVLNKYRKKETKDYMAENNIKNEEIFLAQDDDLE